MLGTILSIGSKIARVAPSVARKVANSPGVGTVLSRIAGAAKAAVDTIAKKSSKVVKTVASKAGAAITSAKAALSNVARAIKSKATEIAHKAGTAVSAAMRKVTTTSSKIAKSSYAKEAAKSAAAGVGFALGWEAAKTFVHSKTTNRNDNATRKSNPVISKADQAKVIDATDPELKRLIDERDNHVRILLSATDPKRIEEEKRIINDLNKRIEDYRAKKAEPKVSVKNAANTVMTEETQKNDNILTQVAKQIEAIPRIFVQVVTGIPQAVGEAAKGVTETAKKVAEGVGKGVSGVINVLTAILPTIITLITLAMLFRFIREVRAI